MRCESAHAVSITGIPNRLDRHSTADCDLEDGHLGSHEGAALDKRWWWNDHGCGSLRPTDQKVDVASLRERLKQPRVDYHLRRDVLFLVAEIERLRAALLRLQSSDRAVHPETYAPLAQFAVCLVNKVREDVAANIPRSEAYRNILELLVEKEKGHRDGGPEVRPTPNLGSDQSPSGSIPQELASDRAVKEPDKA